MKRIDCDLVTLAGGALLLAAMATIGRVWDVVTSENTEVAKVKHLLVFLALLSCMVLAACSASPTPDLEATVQAAVAATQAAQPTNTFTPEPTNTPTPEPTDTPTPEPTDTPTPEPTDTPAPTSTARPTETPMPTDTPEPTATQKPTDTPTARATEIAIVVATPSTSEHTVACYEDGELTYDDVNESDRYVGKSVCWMGKAFNISRDGDRTVFQARYFESIIEGWSFGDIHTFIVWSDGELTVWDDGEIAVLDSDYNDSELLIYGTVDERYEGVDADGVDAQQPVLYVRYVDLSTRDIESTPVPTSAPAPTQPPATSTPIPLSRADDFGVQKQVGSWGMSLYDVKRAKAVYFHDNAEVAQGVWLLPFVEFANLGTGTRSPWEDLDFYLFDDRGWSYEARYSDASLEAGWQFQAGDIMDDINPGLMLGVVLPVDVPEDMGDVWLRVEQDPGFAIYLGNASSIPLE